MELKSNELRIGNYLYNDSIVVKIDARSIFDVWDDKGLKNYKPIPLTEEILLKCGFEVEQMGGYSTGKRIDFNVYRNRHLTFNTSQNQWWINSVANVSIKHLHQLQNLYFALTNEELIINI